MIHYCFAAAQSHSRSPACSTGVFPPPLLLSLSIASSPSALDFPVLPSYSLATGCVSSMESFLLISTEGKRDNSGEVQDCSCHFHDPLYTFSFLFLFMFSIRSSPVLWGGNYTSQLSFFLSICVLCQWRTSIFFKSLGIKRERSL